MARIGLSITKATPFRNSTQEFSNVYYYDLTGNLPDEAEATALIDEVVAVEKTFHTTQATFVRGRLWSAGGSPGTNNMIAQKNLSGNGTITADSNMDKERAFLFRIRAGNDSRGNPVYLRKWYHCNGPFPGSPAPVPAGIQANVSGFTQPQRDAMASNMDTLAEIGGVGAWILCSKNGRLFDSGANFQAHQFLEHHQFGDMWRAA
jgi:hypothetical protein